MRRLKQQYELYRLNGLTRRKAARLALRDLRFRALRQTGHYEHHLHNWRIS